MNVLHGPVNVGSQAGSLAAAENAVRQQDGLPGHSRSVDFEPSHLVSGSTENYPYDRTSRTARWASKLRSLATLAGALPGTQAFHLYFGQTYLRSGYGRPGWGQVDLALLRGLGRTVFMTYQGCDARQKIPSSASQYAACRPGVCQVTTCDAAADELRRQSIEYASRYCHRLFVLNPDLAAFVPGSEFLPYATVPVDSKPSSSRRDPTRKLVLAHAPTDRAIKGTEYVLRAFDSLQEHHSIEVQLFEGMPRAEFLQRLAQVDILVDQLHIGWYGGLAGEAMALGIPVVSYIDTSSTSCVPDEMMADLPIASANPDDIEAVLDRLIRNPSERAERGQGGLHFVQRWLNPQRVARRMLDLYSDPAQSFWAGYDPGKG